MWTLLLAKHSKNMVTKNKELSLIRKLFSIISSKEKKEAIVLLGMLILGMLLEMLSLGMVIPMILAMTKIETLINDSTFKSLLDFFGSPTESQIILILLGVMILAYLSKTGYLLFLTWKQSTFAQRISMNLSRRLFDGYLRQSYSFHVQRNSSALYRNVLGEVDLFTSVIQAILLLQTNISIFLGIFISILIVEPAGASLIFSFFFVFAFVYFKLVKKRLVVWGNKRQYHDTLRSKHLMQGLNGVKDIKILGREFFFIRQFEFHNSESFGIGIKVNVFQQVPRLLLELLAIIGLGLFLAFIIMMGRPVHLLLPVIGIFVAAAFRLVPAIGSVMSAIQTMRYADSVINLMYNEVRSFEDMPETRESGIDISFRQEIKFNNVSFGYPKTEFKLLENASFSIKKNEMIGLIGESGAGKSTMADLLLGFYQPDSGSIEIDGTDISSSMRKWQKQIGYVPQTIYLTDDSIAANIAFGVSKDEVDVLALENAIEIAQLNQFINDLPDGINSVVGERGVRISGGQRQRIGIARALYHNPEVLILDEATSALDVETEKWVMQAINKLHYNKTIIIITHRLSTVERCDIVYKLEKGRLTQVEVSLIDTGILPS